MARVYEFPKRIEAVQKISVIPRVFTQLFEMYQKRQNDIRRKKIELPHKQAYQYFYDIQYRPEPATDSVDIPHFVYEEQRKRRAYDEASKALLDVIRDCRVDECYSKRVKELRRQGIKVSL